MKGETQICGEEEEEFYEKIEAPKFVDFTAPDRYCPDDRFWFCLRLGCDRKHEEEIDHEAISKDFVLRVMAARSPNVKLRKALNRNTYSTKDRCPLSAPAKPTKSRLSKLAVISSNSHKNMDTKANTKPIPKLTSTPKVPKVKQVAAKYLTTPSHKICPTSANKSFRSVQNTKSTNIAVPKTKIVAKALFKSSKKGICVKTSAELRTPLTKICQGIKKLSINSQRKRVLGYSSKSSKEIERKSLCKDKSKTSSLLRPLNGTEHKIKSVRGLKRKSKGEIGKINESMPKGVVENKMRDMEIDTKSRISDENTTNTALADVEEKSIVKFEETDEDIGTKSSTSVENHTSAALADTEERSTVNLEDANKISKANLKEKTEACLRKLRDEDQEIENDDKENGSAALADTEERSIKLEDANKISKANLKEKTEACLRKLREIENVDKENGSAALADTEEMSIVKLEEANKISRVNLKEKTDGCLRKLRDDNQEIEIDDKENGSAPDYNRICGRHVLGKSGTKTNKKVVKTQDRNLKEGLKAVASTGAQIVKYKKPRPTYPKPFRLRTDERGILREANMERKAPMKESEVVLNILTGGLDNKNENETENKPLERSKGDQKARKKSPHSTTPQRPRNLTRQRESEREILGEITDKSTRITKSFSMQPHFMMPIGGASTRNIIVRGALTRKTIVSGLKISDKLKTVVKVPNFQSVQSTQNGRD